MRSRHSAKVDLRAIGRIVALGRPSWVLAVAVVFAMAGAALTGVDPENERAILAALRALMRDRTIIFITHRLASIKDFGHVAVVESGRCTLQGSEEHAVAIFRRV